MKLTNDSMKQLREAAEFWIVRKNTEGALGYAKTLLLMSDEATQKGYHQDAEYLKTLSMVLGKFLVYEGLTNEQIMAGLK